MRCACIDIGSNTTRVLVADVQDGRLREVLCAKAFTRLGGVLRATGSLPPEVISSVARIVAAQHDHAQRAGATRVDVVGTAAIRGAANREELCRAVLERSGLPLRVLSGEEEARRAFTGATATFGRPLDGRVAVVDVGGGSSEVAVGTVGGGVEWWASVSIGSGSLAEECLTSDPPCADDLRAAVRQAERAFGALDVPPVDHAIAVGGSATSTARLVGPLIERERIGSALDALCAAPAQEIARRYGLEIERVRLLPAGLHLLAAAAARLNRPLEVGRGGLREGTCLAMAG